MHQEERASAMSLSGHSRTSSGACGPKNGGPGALEASQLQARYQKRELHKAVWLYASFTLLSCVLP